MVRIYLQYTEVQLFLTDSRDRRRALTPVYNAVQVSAELC